MGKSEDMTSIKTEKGSPSRQEPTQTNIHLYPDWTTIQAYYGPGVPLSQPYYNSAVTAGHVPHPHVWASSQPPMPPYGLPYSTIYSQGVIYAHPAVPLVATPLSAISKSSEDIDQGSTKKLKRFDGHAVPVANDRAEVDAEGSAHDVSQSVGIDVSSDGSDETRAHQSQRRRNSMEHDGKVHAQASTIPEEGETNITSNTVCAIPEAPENVARNSVESPIGKADTRAACGATGLPFEVWVKDERQLKRERRKQANRESARRSRLRKQAEIEELMERYESLKMENLTLKSEMNQLTEDSEKVRLENAALAEKVNNSHLGQLKKLVPDMAV